MLRSQLEAPTKGRGLDTTSPLGLGLPGAISLGLCLLGDISRGRSAGRKGSGDSRRGGEEAGAERAGPHLPVSAELLQVPGPCTAASASTSWSSCP